MAMTPLYRELHQQLQGLLDGESDWIANLANTAALLWLQLPDINWVGFYLRRGDQLVLGPFQGKPACTRIPLGRGVCGTAAAVGTTQLVADVHQFPGHIACDTASNSEIVVPVMSGGEVIGVLDVDSPMRDRFAAEDRIGLERVVELLTATASGPGGRAGD